jgi:16S rRNA (cytosine1402-N4)-methyltransferase
VTNIPSNVSLPAAAAERPKRRLRYRGTHPRRFEEKYKEHSPGKYPEAVRKVMESGKTPAGTHRPVAVREIMEILTPRPGETAVDCTLGYGGHAAEILQRILPGGRLIGLDVDPLELPKTEARLRGPGITAIELGEAANANLLPLPARHEWEEGRVEGNSRKGGPPLPGPLRPRREEREKLDRPGVVSSSNAMAVGPGIPPEALTVCRSNFAGLPRVLAAHGISGVDLVLADLGCSSMQLDNPARGFSFKLDGPLDLRMNPTKGRPASALLASLDAPTLATLLRENADEPRADLIAQSILAAQARSPITATSSLTAAVRASWPRSSSAIEREASVRRVFQALRIAVNDEFSALETLLRLLPGCLNPGARVAILTFHSGEDRRVKKAFQEGRRSGVYSEVARDVIRPSAEEVRANPRASSAKLRWALKAAHLDTTTEEPLPSPCP